MKSNFQMIILVVFVVFLAIGVLAFSGVLPVGKKKSVATSGTVVVWGTLPPAALQDFVEGIQNENKGLNIQYVPKNPLTFDAELIEALAASKGPDLFFLPQDKVVQHSDKVFIIPYESYDQEVFYSQFLDEANIFLHPDGVLAFPFLIDPMVMYYNKDIVSSAFIIDPPAFWDEFLTFAPHVTQTTESGEVITSAVALGTFNNILYAKDILALMVLQAGGSIMVPAEDGSYVSTVTQSTGPFNPVESAINFFTTFSDPAQDSYSWNPSLPTSREAFIAGDLAVYLGYASEVRTIREQNPNLNFEATLVPQTRGQKRVVSHGRMVGLALSKQSKNPAAAFTVASIFTSPNIVQAISKELALPPVRKEVLSQRPEDAFSNLLYDSAIISRTWHDPEPATTDAIFGDIIRAVNAGEMSPGEAVNRLDAQLRSIR